LHKEDILDLIEDLLETMKCSKEFRYYIEKGTNLGKPPGLFGKGLIRSLGGWEEVVKIRLTVHDRIKSDQRILGYGGFVAEVLSESTDPFSWEYRLNSLEPVFEKILRSVSGSLKVAF